ncbi:sensor histidine kinase [Microbispora sp. KK1-11]|uniref:sensor histidine kinase n=1 Tax=Microbispora sp. KK1-11 TaxID=2053005 RepID=UPI001158F314|nr:sensor histidine kinase [Microbispora sp. KK1-11]TQS25050.1 sensor histidine kinase [Microbispora sp. KK1-11]
MAEAAAKARGDGCEPGVARPGRFRPGLPPWLPARLLASALGLTVLLLLAPAAAAASAVPAWPAWILVAAAGVSFSGAVLTAARSGPGVRPVPVTFVALLAAVTVTAALAYHVDGWQTLFSLLAVAVALVLPVRAAPPLVAVTAAIAAIVPVGGRSFGDALWGTALTTLFAGITTYGFRRMSEVIEELGRTREKLAVAAVSAERLRFSRDLHDLLGHTLSMVVVKAEAVRRLAPRDTDAAIRHAADIEAIGRQALTEVREAVTGYRDASLAFELDSARAALATAGVACVVKESGPALTRETDMLLSWVVREGITNVVRHSGARRCVITLRRDRDPVLVEISDDGAGGVAGEEDGSGLRGLRERLAAAGGRLTAARLARGFVLTAEIPHAGVDDDRKDGL